MTSELILALDIGTTSSRAALFDVNGVRLPTTEARQVYPMILSADGGAEIDPPVLLGAVLHCLEQTLRAWRVDPQLHSQPIVAIGAACFWHSLLGCDADGLAITRIFTSADSRSHPEAAKLRERFDERKVHARTGCMLRSAFWPAKLRWLERTHHRKFTAVKQWMSPAEWLQIALAGEAHCGTGMAGGTGLFNPNTLRWDLELLKYCEVDASHLRQVSEEPTPVDGRLAAQFPELKGVPWFPAIGNGAASSLGSGATRPGYGAIDVGETGALWVIHQGREAQVPQGLSCHRIDAGRSLIGGTVSNAGNLRVWCLRELRLAPECAIETALAKRPAPDHGLVVLPFWNAERAPTWAEDVPGTIHGLNERSTALDILQATTEATYHRFARIAEQLASAQEKSAPKFIVSGGIVQSPSSLQRLSDVLGHTIFPCNEADPSLRGAAIFAMEKLNLTTPDAHLGRAVRPRTKYVKLYEAARERQRALETLTPAEW